VEVDLELVMSGATSVSRCLLGGGLTRLEVLPITTELIRVVEVVEACFLFLCGWLPHHMQNQLSKLPYLLIKAPPILAVPRVELMKKLVC
jgi:hypothetical protein